MELFKSCLSDCVMVTLTKAPFKVIQSIPGMVSLCGKPASLGATSAVVALSVSINNIATHQFLPSLSGRSLSAFLVSETDGLCGILRLPISKMKTGA